MRLRHTLSVLLAFLGGLAGVAGLVLLVARHSLFDRATVSRTTSTIVADPDVERLLGREITKRIVALGGLQQQNAAVEAVVAGVLTNPLVRQEVHAGVLRAYDVLVAANAETIVFDLPNEAIQLRAETVAVLPALDAVLPPANDLLKFELFRRTDLPQIYRIVKATRTAAWVLFIGGLACLLVALVISPSRFALFAGAAAVVVVSMFTAYALISTASAGAINSIEDPLSRRVARLATDSYLADLNNVAIGVVVFGIIAVIVGIGAAWIRGVLFPPSPKPYKVGS